MLPLVQALPLNASTLSERLIWALGLESSERGQKKPPPGREGALTRRPAQGGGGLGVRAQVGLQFFFFSGWVNAFEEIPVSVELHGNNETNLVQEVGRLNRVSIEDRLRKFRGHNGVWSAIDGPLPSEIGVSSG